MDRLIIIETPKENEKMSRECTAGPPRFSNCDPFSMGHLINGLPEIDTIKYKQTREGEIKVANEERERERERPRTSLEKQI